MKKTLIAASLAAMFIGTSAIAIANPQTTLPGNVMEMARKSPEERINKRVEHMKTELSLTADQQKLWTPYEAALRGQMDNMKGMKERRESMKNANGLERINMRAEMSARMAAQQKAIADAAKPLYDSLNADQKAKFDKMMTQHGKRGHGRN